MKNLSKILLMFLCLVSLVGCGAPKLSANYSEEKLKAAAEEIISKFNEEKYDDVAAKLKADLRKDLPASKLKEVWSNYKNIGKYDSLSKIAFQEKNDYAVVVAIAKYEKRKVQFTLSFNKDMEMVGIYIK